MLGVFGQNKCYFFDQFEGSACGAQALPFRLIKKRGNIVSVHANMYGYLFYLFYLFNLLRNEVPVGV